jgi:hypothetical protein
MFLKKQKQWVLARDGYLCQLPQCNNDSDDLLSVCEILTKEKAKSLNWEIDSPFNSPFNAITVCWKGYLFLQDIIEEEIFYFLNLIKKKTLNFIRIKPYPIKNVNFYNSKNIFFNIQHP